MVKVSSSRQLTRSNPVALLDYNDAEKVAHRRGRVKIEVRTRVGMEGHEAKRKQPDS